VFALVITALAALLRELFTYLGATLYFPTFFPAVALVALIAGLEAGALVVLLAILTAWWAFVLPRFAFSTISLSDGVNFFLFGVAAAVIIGLAHCVRAVLEELNRQHTARELMLREMHHRSRNTFAAIESIVRATLSGDPVRSEAVLARVRAVMRTNELIANAVGQQMSAKVLVDQELSAFQRPNALKYEGFDIPLNADSTRALALVIHELTTNAVKYGALSVPTGRIVVRGRCEGESAIIEWRESGGPPVNMPNKTGFGTKLITRSVSAIGGEAVSSFENSGLICRICFPIEEALPRSRSLLSQVESQSPSIDKTSTHSQL
jgi:two-component sensor histidine kinase